MLISETGCWGRLHPDAGEVSKGGMSWDLERARLEREAEEPCWVDVCWSVQAILLAWDPARRQCPLSWHTAQCLLESRQEGPSCLRISLGHV